MAAPLPRPGASGSAPEDMGRWGGPECGVSRGLDLSGALPGPYGPSGDAA